MHYAEENFSDLVGNPSVAVLVTEVVRVLQQETIGQEALGVVKLRIRRNLTPKRWHGPEEFDVTFTQYKEPLARSKWLVGWNTVDVRPGQLVLLAVHDVVPEPPPKTRPWVPIPALAVSPLESLTDPLVASTQKAVQAIDPEPPSPTAKPDAQPMSPST